MRLLEVKIDQPPDAFRTLFALRVLKGFPGHRGFKRNLEKWSQ